MSEAPESIFEPADLPPGTAPQFGEGEPHAFPASTPLVLSALAERRESHGYSLLAERFALKDIPATGNLTILASSIPGVVHIDADIRFDLGGVLHYEADVRESWVARTTEAGHTSPERIVRALADVANLPHQSTVKVHFQA